MIRGLLNRTSTYFGGMSIAKVLSAVAFILFARILPTNEFGLLVFFHTTIYLFGAIAEFGLNLYYQKHYSEKSATRYFHRIFSASIVSSSAVAILAGFIFYILGTFNVVQTILWIISILAFVSGEITRGYYLSSGRPMMIPLRTIVISLILIISIVFQHITLNQAYFLTAFGFLTGTMLVFPWKIMHSYTFSGIKQAIKTIKSSLPYSFLIITSLFYARGDHVIMNYTLNSTALGIYGIAYRFLEALTLLPTALSHNLFPLASKKNGVSFKQLMHIVLISSFVGFLLSLILFVVSEPLITMTVGNKYVQAIAPLRIFSVVLFLFFVNAPLSTAVMSSDYIKSFLPFGIANTIANLLLNILLVPIFGLISAAFIMLFTEFTGLLINMHFVRLRYKHHEA